MSLELLPILAIPLGVAGQNLISGIFLIAAIWHLVKSKKARVEALQIWQQFRWPTLFGVAMTLWLAVATSLNPNNPSNHGIEFVCGYLALFILPLLFPLLLTRKSLAGGVSWLFALWGLLCWSQWFRPWQFEVGAFLIENPRPRGLYSHPLTYAYVALLLWPTVLSLMPKNFLSWPQKGCLLFGTISPLLLTMSRTAQVCALMITGLFILRLPRLRWPFLGALFGLLLIFATFDNPIRRRFLLPFGERTAASDIESPYADDRLAFWAIHWQMVKERPWLGHGIDLNKAYRTPYYEQAGLGFMKKKYEAHQQLLQLLAEGGLVGLGLFLAWLISWWRQLQLPRDFQWAARMTFFALLFGGLTQNAFQDAEVRYTLAVLLGLFVSVATTKNA